MKPAKLFVTDIDDTLSVGETVPEETQKACRRLKDSGWDIMIATGRTFGTAKNHMKAACATQPAILCDGAKVAGLGGDEIRSSFMDRRDLARLLDAIWDMPLEIQLTGDEVVYCRESDGETIRFYRQAGVDIHYIGAPAGLSGIYRVGLWVRPEKLFSAEESIKKISGDAFDVIPGGAMFLDVLPKGVNKGSALKGFVSGLPERPRIIVAAGDHHNDLAMLQYADFAAAPSNAAPSVLSAADFVMPPASQRGICELIGHILSPEFEARFGGGPAL